MKLMDSCVLIMLLFVYFRNPWLKSRFFLNLCQLKCLIFILLYKITAKLSKNQFHEIFGLIWLTMSTEKYQSLPQLLLWGIFINYCKGGVIDSTADHADIRGLVTA